MVTQWDQQVLQSHAGDGFTSFGIRGTWRSHLTYWPRKVGKRQHLSEAVFGHRTLSPTVGNSTRVLSEHEWALLMGLCFHWPTRKKKKNCALLLHCHCLRNTCPALQCDLDWREKSQGGRQIKLQPTQEESETWIGEGDSDKDPEEAL